ncbi:hypothetical protein VII00023_03078 [Vibrio ichthyoenteri ATCC 700023]|uniref:TonB system biopolymer transport component n=1 Tax=Vibrio ichthyoenteri ATCC 700023 TaxID=870968 RepID=F9RYI4_9VIBR|nr:DUF3450 domain-containing protein [Vibrio ichthyoenteri]EGU46401.1 hypothetical protein VII00023_03078 [Vibrio ichthyoenteri ATCC 700023]
MNLFKTSLAIVIAAATSPVSASSLDSAQAIQNKTNAASASSQKRIDNSADTSLRLQAEIEQLEEEVKNLEVYQKHLNALIVNQEQEMANIDAQVQEIKVTRQGVVPLMYQMVDALKLRIDADAPIKKQQRFKRVEKLQVLMTRADISDAEKYRRILEAYQIEMDYGTKLGLYQGQITLAGENREADILHLGRIALIARSLNGNTFWAWDKQANDWVEVDSSLKSELDKAYAMAAKQTAPSLITVPVSLLAETK